MPAEEVDDVDVEDDDSEDDDLDDDDSGDELLIVNVELVISFVWNDGKVDGLQPNAVEPC